MKEHVVIVTGAAHPEGIGHAIAMRFAKEGSKVFVLDLVESTSDEVTSIVCSVSDRASVDAAIQNIIDDHDQVDVLVNNAGVARGADFLSLSEDDWRSSIDVNLLGTANVCQAVIPHMSDGGRVINIASLAGLGALDGIPACYTATKFAVIGLTKQLALELAPRGITCNAVCPGSIKTQMHALALQQIAEAHAVDLDRAQEIEDEAIPMGSSAEPTVVADVVHFLAGPGARYVTGTATPVAGGMSPGL